MISNPISVSRSCPKACRGGLVERKKHGLKIHVRRVSILKTASERLDDLYEDMFVGFGRGMEGSGMRNESSHMGARRWRSKCWLRMATESVSKLADGDTYSRRSFMDADTMLVEWVDMAFMKELEIDCCCFRH